MKWYTLRSKMSRMEAKIILDSMQEIIDAYGYVTLADFYDLIDIKSVYTDSKIGWCSLTGARVSLFRKHGSYIIELPLLDYIEQK